MNEVSKNKIETKDVMNKNGNALNILAQRLNVGPETLKKTLMATAFKTCTNEADFISAVIVANTYRLNPILKEMYAFPSKGGGVIPIVGIDGWISLVNRQENFDGVELIENNDESHVTGLKSVTAKFYIKGKSHPVVVTEYMSECYNEAKEPWKKWPRRMLRHKAYIQGARIAFGFSGIYDEDEATRIIEAQDAEFKEQPGKPEVRMPQAVSEKENLRPEDKPEDRVESQTWDELDAQRNQSDAGTKV